jgi:hypothetical protein
MLMPLRILNYDDDRGGAGGDAYVNGDEQSPCFR